MTTFSKEHIKKLSQAHKGVRLSKKHREAISKAVKKRFDDGEIPWNRGRKQTEEHKLMMSETMKKRPNSGWFKKGMKAPKTAIKKGEHLSKSTEFKKGSKPWWIVRGIPHPDKGLFKKGHPFVGDLSKSLMQKGKPSLWKGRHPTRETIRKMLTRRPMSSLEIKMQGIIDKHKLPYKFVGNGAFFIERKNPDFVNINGEKKAVEVYYRKHKELFKGNVEAWKKERKAIFNKYGWQLFFFDETQVTEYDILRGLKP